MNTIHGRCSRRRDPTGVARPITLDAHTTRLQVDGIATDGVDRSGRTRRKRALPKETSRRSQRRRARLNGRRNERKEKRASEIRPWSKRSRRSSHAAPAASTDPRRQRAQAHQDGGDVDADLRFLWTQWEEAEQHAEASQFPTRSQVLYWCMQASIDRPASSDVALRDATWTMVQPTRVRGRRDARLTDTDEGRGRRVRHACGDEATSLFESTMVRIESRRTSRRVDSQRVCECDR